MSCTKRLRQTERIVDFIILIMWLWLLITASKFMNNKNLLTYTGVKLMILSFMYYKIYCSLKVIQIVVQKVLIKSYTTFESQSPTFPSTKINKYIQTYNTLIIVIFIITSFPTSELFARNFWSLPAIWYFFEKFNAYFNQRNDKQSFNV